jgi:hypothetical protein
VAPSHAARIGALSLALLAASTSCKYSQALEKREAVVLFQPGATQAQHRLVRSACSGIPGVVVEPMGHGKQVAELASNVRFRIDKADDAQLAQLSLCLRKYPDIVLSFDIPDASH